MEGFTHVSVLLQQAVDALDVRQDGIYVDATAGGGGHSAEILSRLGRSGRLIDVDRDPDAVEHLRRRFADDPRVTVVQALYSDLDAVLFDLGIPAVDGILADLGVSTHQLDTAERGFSFHADAPLDMRMSRTGVSAYDAVNDLSYEALRDILYRYGEEKFAPAIASGIVRQREKAPIRTTFELCEVIDRALPAKAKRDGHPARKTFQALRIYVNGELDLLPGALDDMFRLLTPGGRLAVISFHSLEDKAVKDAFSRQCEKCTCPPDFPICVCGKAPKGRLPFRFIRPDADEQARNPRSRSAKLRCIEKL